MPWKDYERLLSKVAAYHYVEEKSQLEIAQILGFSRSKICRMIAEAKNLGIVQISVKYPVSTCNDLEMQFEKRFKLREAIIVNDFEEDNVMPILGQAGADYLRRVVTSEDIIGISWGETLFNVVNQLQQFHVAGTKVVQLVGGLNNSGQNLQAVELARRLGEFFNSEPTLLHCPAVVTNPLVKEGLLEDENIQKVIELWKKTTIALVGIGSMSPDSELFKNNHLSLHWHEMLDKSVAVGDVCMRFFDQAGNNSCEELNELIMGITLETLKAVGTVVCIARGTEKANAILGALNCGIPNVLITDRETAKRILKIDKD